MKTTKKLDHFSPLPQCLTIRESSLHGLGLFATENIDANVDLGLGWVADDHYPDGYIRTPLGGFINHSDSPNCTDRYEGRNIILVTAQPIEQGDEITISYRGWYSDETLDNFN